MTPERDIVRILQASAVVGALEAFRRGLGRMIAASRLVTWSRGVAGRAVAQTGAERRGQAGVVLLTATLVHVSLTWVNGRDPGWIWLLVPVLASLTGVLLLATAAAARRESRFRA